MTAAPVEKFAASQTMSVGTEHILAESGGSNDIGTSGVFVLRIDMNALINGDIVEVRAYTKARSADSIRQEWQGTYANVQSNINRASTPLIVTAYGKFTVKQTAVVALLTGITSDITTDFFTKTAHGLNNNDAVVFAALASTGCTAGTVYYVVNKTTNTFQVAATVGGSAINLTGTNDTVATLSMARAVPWSVMQL